MPYNPGNQNRAGEIWGNAFANIGQSLGNTITEVGKVKAERDYLSGMADYYYGSGLIDDKTYQDFLSGNVGKQRAVISGAATDQAMQQRQDTMLQDYYLKQQASIPRQVPTAGMEDYYYSPRTGQVISPQDMQQTPALGEDPTGTGDYYWTGSRLAQKRGERLSQSDRTRLEMSNNRIAEYDKEIAEMEGEIAKGDKRYGFLNTQSRESRIEELQQLKMEEEKKKEMLIGKTESAPTAGTGAQEMTDEDRQMLEWAQGNPNDPLARQILQAIGGGG